MPPEFNGKKIKNSLYEDLASMPIYHATLLNNQPDYVPIYMQKPKAEPKLVQNAIGEDDVAVFNGDPDMHTLTIGNIKIFDVVDEEGFERQKKDYAEAVNAYEKDIDNAFERIRKDPVMDYSNEEIDFAKECTKKLHLKKFQNAIKGFPTPYIHIRSIVYGGFNALYQCANKEISEDLMEAFRIEKKGIDIIGEDGKTRNIKPLPLIEGYVGHLDIVNAFVDYWDAQEKGTLSPVSVVEKREAMIKQIEKTLPVLTKLAQHDTNGLSSKLTDAYLGQSIGGDPVSHMSESYTRGLADTIHGLSTMYLGLKAGWSMDDVNLLSVFNSYAMSKDVNEYQTDKKPVYKDGEKEFIKKCSDYMKKVTSSPIKSASDRKNMLDELKALYKEGCDKEYIGTAYRNAIGFELDRIEKISPGIEKTSYQTDMEGALKHFNTVRVMAFGKESDEHKKVREAAEKVIRLKKELSGEKKAGANKEGRSREVIESELKNAISDMNTLADSYISRKKTIPGSPAGKDRLYGAAELRMIGREMLNEMERSAENLPGMELAKFKNKFKENASQAEIESLESVINQRKQKETEMRKIKENIDFSKDRLLSAAAAITITHYRNNKNVLDTNGKEIPPEEFMNKLKEEKAFQDVVNRYDSKALQDMSRNHTIKQVVYEAYRENKRQAEIKNAREQGKEIQDQNINKQENKAVNTGGTVKDNKISMNV